MFKGKLFQGMCAVLAAVTTLGMLAGCQTNAKQTDNAEPMRDLSAPVKPENRYKVVADPTAAFFRYSPQQAAGADQRIPKETRVELLSRLAGYSKVKLPVGTIGYMDSADLSHLSPKEIADEDALVAAQQAAATALAASADGTGLNNANIGNGGDYRPPSEAGRSEPLPAVDPTASPTPPPSTMFRY